MPTDTPTASPTLTATPPAPGVLVVQVFAEDGSTRLGGVCLTLTGETPYSVCDDGQADADPSAGNIELIDVAAGDYELSVQPPDSYEPVGDVPATLRIDAGEIESLTLTFRPVSTATPTATATAPVPEEPGVLILLLTQEDGTTPLGGVCLNLSGPALYQVCDDGEQDADPTLGILEIDDVAAGEYAIVITPPEGFEAIEPPVTADVPPGDVAQIALSFRTVASPIATEPTEEATPEPPVEGVVVVASSLEDGATPIGGVCLALTGPDTYEVCDDGDGDADPTLGAIEIGPVTSGDYTLTVTPPKGYEAITPPAIVSVPAGVAQVILTFREAIATPAAATAEATPTQIGFVIAVVTGEDGVTPLGGACLTLTGPETYDVCDDGEGDADQTPGTIELDSVVAGDYAVAAQPPPDHEPVGEQPTGVRVDPDDFAELTFVFRPTVPVPTGTPTLPEPGSLTLLAVDPAGNPVPGACFATTLPDGTPLESCDDDEDVGETFDGLVAGDYTVTMVSAPAGYEAADATERLATVVAGQSTEVRFSVRPVQAATGSLVISKVDAADGTTPLGGACFTVTAADGASEDGCDDDGDGLTRFDGLASGEWSIHETQAPEGFAPGPNQSVTVPAGAEATATVLDEKLPTRTGSLVAFAVDLDDNPVPGACYAASGPDGAAVDGCDDDGDGQADLGQVPVGEWLVRQTDPPAGYDPGDPPEQPVTVTTDQPGEPRFVNAPTPPDQLRLPPPLPRPTSVIAVGDFQDELGCPQDDDPTCPATALTDDHGVWIGNFQIPPGTYALRLVATSDDERSLGKGGDPSGDDLVITVPEGSASVYVQYDPATGRIVTAARPIRAQLASEVGVVELRPIEHGLFEGYVDVPADGLPVQILFNGQVVGEDRIERDQEGRVRVVVDDAGGIARVDPVTPSALTVTRTDANGEVVSGSCFAVLLDNALVGQACDADDGSADGITTLEFPNGIAGGTYTLKETLTPDGATPAEDQLVDLADGDNQAEVTA